MDFVKLQATVLRLINSNGRDLTLVKQDNVPTNPLKPYEGSSDPSGPSAVKKTMKGIFVPPTAINQFGLSALGKGSKTIDLFINSEQIIIVPFIEPEQYYEEGYIEEGYILGSFEISEFQEVIDGVKTWGINATQILQPGDTPLLGYIGVSR